ncbi:hypothetical protein [Marinobacter caseinilyticus]|uniref:hypothetical protein n=1 Tax=Marinobacter caseinilyticus TaxID=2692195 RepID=UPI00140A2822|nr:hypothetical protein [Marinobacter caseinilyticus]
MRFSYGLEVSTRVLIFSALIIGFQVVFSFEYSLGLLTNKFINIPDHEFYYTNISSSNLIGAFSSFNNFVIVKIYGFFYAHGFNVELISFFINACVLIFSYWLLEFIIYFKTGRFFQPQYLITLFAIFQFSVLINKDSFAVLFYISLMSYALTNNRRFLLISIVLIPIRIQFLFIFICFIIFQYLQKKSWTFILLGVLFFYFLGGMASVFLERSEVILGHQNYNSSGLAYLISWLNEKYFIGSILFNFVKPIQYFWDLMISLSVPGSVISFLVFFGRFSAILLISINFYRILSIIYMPWKFRNYGELLALNALVVSFFLIYIISPVVNYRYLLDFFPVILIAVILHRRRYPLKIRII